MKEDEKPRHSGIERKGYYSVILICLYYLNFYNKIWWHLSTSSPHTPPSTSFFDPMHSMVTSFLSITQWLQLVLPICPWVWAMILLHQLSPANSSSVGPSSWIYSIHLCWTFGWCGLCFCYASFCELTNVMALLCPEDSSSQKSSPHLLLLCSF